MKKIIILLMITASPSLLVSPLDLLRLSPLTSHLSPLTSLRAQDIRYETDESCGCDIMYVDGIETTRDGDRYGFRRDDGTIIAPNIYKYVGQFEHGWCRVWMDDTLCGLIDSTGRQVVPCRYTAVEYPTDNRILVSKASLMGFYDCAGRMAIPLQEARFTPFSEGRATTTVVVDTYFVFYTYIDTLGRQLFPPIYQNAIPYSDGYAAVIQYERWGFIDREGREVMPPRYELLSPIDHGLFFAGDEGGLALFDLTFKPLTPFHYYPATPFSEGRIGVFRDGKRGFLDPAGREVVPCIYDETGLFRQGRTLARIGDRYGIIDTMGREILPLEYSNRTPKGDKYMYSDSLALVERDGRLGFVDLEGKLVIPFYFEEAYAFSQGLAAVRKEGFWGYVNTKGDIYLPFIFDIASPFEYGRAEVYFNGIGHKIDLDGKCVRNCHGIVSFR